MFNSDCDTDSTIDFEFFEGEGDHIKNYELRNQIDCSKITTKAVIETKPFQMIVLPSDRQYPKDSGRPKQKEDLKSEQSQTCSIIDYLSSPSPQEKLSLLDTNLDSYLLNCLAYNDEKQSSVIYPLEDKYSSDSSLSESTITTVSSDFTSVSPLLSVSDSSCLSDESVDDLTHDNENEGEENINNEEAAVVLCQTVDDNKDTLVGNISEENIELLCQTSEKPESDNEDSWSNNSSLFSETKINSENSNEIGCSDYGSEKHINEDNVSETEEADISALQEDLGEISLASQSSSTRCSSKTVMCRGSSKLRMRKKESNLTFSREELIKIERENLILLKKIMSHAKPRTISLNQTHSHKKTSAAINRAKQQKKIEQDNYVLYSKISALGRMKKVF